MAELKLLFVDNSKTTRATMERFLAKEGFEVQTAASGAEAIEKFQAESFDVIVMDLFMPMMNGYEAAKKIRELPHDAAERIPILALTASQEEKDFEVAMQSGMNEVIEKSPDHQALLDALSRYGQ